MIDLGEMPHPVKNPPKTKYEEFWDFVATQVSVVFVVWAVVSVGLIALDMFFPNLHP